MKTWILRDFPRFVYNAHNIIIVISIWISNLNTWTGFFLFFQSQIDRQKVRRFISERKRWDIDVKPLKKENLKKMKTNFLAKSIRKTNSASNKLIATFKPSVKFMSNAIWSLVGAFLNMNIHEMDMIEIIAKSSN